ncbi:MAG: transglycosylase SLT domain-containing protein [Patescibacteria group bacterium]|nr:transglycosylase SLT domain-containing protein [Patescibacteria group bacterium]
MKKFYLKIVLMEAGILCLAFLTLATRTHDKSRQVQKVSSEKENVMESVLIEMSNGKRVAYNDVKITLRKDSKGKFWAYFSPKKKTSKAKPANLKQLVRDLAEEASFENVDLLYRIIKCESGWRPQVSGPTGDYGLFQIVPEHNPGVSKKNANDPIFATKWAIGQIKAGNIWKWNASRHCWGG